VIIFEIFFNDFHLFLLKNKFEKISKDLMFNHIEVNQGIHKKNSFFIITFLRKIDFIIVQISKKSFKTAINFINYRPQYCLFFIKNLVHYFIPTPKNSGQIWRKVTLFSTNKILYFIVGIINCQNIFTETVLFFNLTD